MTCLGSIYRISAMINYYKYKHKISLKIILKIYLNLLIELLLPSKEPIQGGPMTCAAS